MLRPLTYEILFMIMFYLRFVWRLSVVLVMAALAYMIWCTGSTVLWAAYWFGYTAIGLLWLRFALPRLELWQGVWHPVERMFWAAFCVGLWPIHTLTAATNGYWL